MLLLFKSRTISS